MIIKTKTLSHVMRHMSTVTCHQRQQPQPQPQTLPLSTPPLCIGGWFVKIKSSKPAILAICFLTRSLQSTQFRVPAEEKNRQINRQTYIITFILSCTCVSSRHSRKCVTLLKLMMELKIL